MPPRNSPRGRARSRKRRRAPKGAHKDAAAASTRVEAAGEAAVKGGAGAARAQPGAPRARKRSAPSESALYTPGGVGERPQAPWHPLPLSEILILAGAIGAAIGFSRGVSHGAAPMFAGLAAVLAGTLEFTLREHLSGYRSHAIIIAVIAVAAFHTGVALVVAAFTHVPRALNVALVAADIALFAALFKYLRSRFLDARRERVFAGGR